MAADENDLDIVKQCIEIIEQEALSLMVDPGGENRADGDAKLAEVLQVLGANGKAVERPSDSRDLQEKLSLLTRGMHLLSEQIHSKTEELKAVEDLQKDPRENSSPAQKANQRLQASDNPPSPTGLGLLPPTPERPRQDFPEPQDVGQGLYSDTLARLAQSHAELKSRIISLESENKRLQDEANLRSMEERNRLLQVESILKGEDERVSRLGARPARPSVPSVPRPKAKPRCAERAVTPPPPTMRIPHWRNDRPSWNRSPERRAPGPGPGPAGSSQSRYAPQERSSAGLTGRTTPPKPKMGRSTPPRPRAVPKVSPRSGADGVPMRGTPPAPSFPATARGLTSSIREARPERRSERSGSASPPRGARHTSTPPAPSSRPNSPRSFNEKELPPHWRQMVGDAYCQETGRPFVDRITLLDFTSASSKMKPDPVFWVNVRLRWADLQITEIGRVPKRGEALALFVLQGTTGERFREWQSNGRRSTSRPVSPRRAPLAAWHVASMRVLRNLPFSEKNSMPLVAHAGGGLLRMALGFTPCARRYHHVVRPPSWSTPVTPSSSNPNFISHSSLSC